MELTEELIKRRSKQFDLGCITLLDLSSAGLRRLGHLDACVNVTTLNLANNEVDDLDGLPVLLSLLSLDLSNNRLSSIADLPRFPALEELILSDNQLFSIDFHVLASRLPRLRKLQLERNPVEATGAAFVHKVQAAFPNLVTVNGEALAFYEALNQEPATGQRPQPPSASFVAASPAKTGPTSFKLAPFDAEKFANDASTRLEQMLLDAKQTLDGESKRVEQAFRFTAV